MGQHAFAPKLYYHLGLDDLVPQDHLLRRIAQLIDLSFVYGLARPYYSFTGQPSIDPIVLFKALLVGYLYGITPERRLMAEIQVNLAYRWFVGYDLDEPIPNHSVLSKARARFGPSVFETFFSRTVELCQAAGLIRGDAAFIDSTLIQANASMDALEPIEPHTPPMHPSDYVQRVFAGNRASGIEVGEPEDAGTNVKHNTDGNEGDTQLPANERHRSRTDPEASIIRHPNFGTHLAYKAHVAVDSHPARVITAAVVTSGSTADEHVLAELYGATAGRSAAFPRR